MNNAQSTGEYRDVKINNHVKSIEKDEKTVECLDELLHPMSYLDDNENVVPACDAGNLVV
ncbi:MAG: hypothetical protein ACR5K2_00230 [Wolbachia sp.]